MWFGSKSRLIMLGVLVMRLGHVEGNRRSKSRNLVEFVERDNEVMDEDQDVAKENEEFALKRARNDTGRRRGKLFSLFNIVTFRNDPCASTQTLSGNGANRNGTCYTAQECQSKGGRAQGNCAAGFGVCCIFILKKDGGGNVNYNCSYIQNPTFPAAQTVAKTFTYTVNKCSSDVCWIRLDFESFTIQGNADTTEADNTGCETDQFSVSTDAGQNIPQICGENTGHHMYIDIGSTVTLTFNIAGTSALWDIKISQIECNNPTRPPNGCLQYHTSLTGQLTTFNWNNAAETHLANQEYSMCIRKEAGFCCIEYQLCSNVLPAMAMSLSSMPTTADQDDNCTTVDHIIIPASSGRCTYGQANLAFNSRYCGPNLNVVDLATNIPICDCSPPFLVGVYTNAISDAGAGKTNGAGNPLSRGLCLEYKQLPCA